jgi:hypothetical protein
VGAMVESVGDTYDYLRPPELKWPSRAMVF